MVRFASSVWLIGSGRSGRAHDSKLPLTLRGRARRPLTSITIKSIPFEIGRHQPSNDKL